MTTLHVEDFGARKDGITDDTAALQAMINNDDTLMIQSAIDASNSEDDEIVFAHRTYRVNSTILLKRCKYSGNKTLINPCPGVYFDFCFATDPGMDAIFVLSDLKDFTLSVLGITINNGKGGMVSDFIISG